MTQFTTHVAAPARRRKRSYSRPQAVYLTAKMQTWMRLKGLWGDSRLQGEVKAAKELYDYEKENLGLASIPLIQMEVENALVLASKGKYKRSK